LIERRLIVYLLPTTRLTGKPRRRREPGRGVCLTTRPTSERLEMDYFGMHRLEGPETVGAQADDGS